MDLPCCKAPKLDQGLFRVAFAADICYFRTTLVAEKAN